MSQQPITFDSAFKFARKLIKVKKTAMATAFLNLTCLKFWSTLAVKKKIQNWL